MTLFRLWFSILCQLLCPQAPYGMDILFMCHPASNLGVYASLHQNSTLWTFHKCHGDSMVSWWYGAWSYVLTCLRVSTTNSAQMYNLDMGDKESHFPTSWSHKIDMTTEPFGTHSFSMLSCLTVWSTPSAYSCLMMLMITLQGLLSYRIEHNLLIRQIKSKVVDWGIIGNYGLLIYYMVEAVSQHCTASISISVSISKQYNIYTACHMIWICKVCSIIFNTPP